MAGLVGASAEDDFRSEPRSELVTADQIAVELINRFPDDDQIWSSLAGEFQSGSWVGPWSDRIRHQLDLLESWRADPTLPRPFKDWTQQMSRSLERQLVDQSSANRKSGFRRGVAQWCRGRSTDRSARSVAGAGRITL